MGDEFRPAESIALVRSSKARLPLAAARMSIASSSLEPAQSSDLIWFSRDLDASPFRARADTPAST